MVQFVTIDEKSSITGQIQLADLHEAAKLGYTLIINNRPDGESVDQPRSKDLVAEATKLGITFVNLPFSIPAQVTPAQVAEFIWHFRTTNGKVLAYCRSGMRSIVLWAAAAVALGTPVNEVLAKAARVGFNLQQATGFLQDLAQAAARQPAA
jgi:uncharacterized protein (TIGR01244 family)